MPFWEAMIWSILIIVVVVLLGVAIGGAQLMGVHHENISAIAIIIASIATIVAVYFGFHTAHISAVLRVAEFRQQWINGLRDDLARFHAIGVTPGHAPDEDMEFYRIGTRVELMMNPSDPDYRELQDIMYKYLETSRSDQLEKYTNNPRLVAISQRILKREWDRLKGDVRARRI